MYLVAAPLYTLQVVAEKSRLALGLIMSRYEPRIAKSKRSYQTATITTPQAKHRRTSSKWRQTSNVTRLRQGALDEDLTVTVLIDACVPELRPRRRCGTGKQGSISLCAPKGAVAPWQIGRFPWRHGARRRRRRRTLTTPRSPSIGEVRGCHAT